MDSFNNNNNNNNSQNQGHASRLTASYTKFKFKSDPNDPQDSCRETLFQRLIQHHLLQNRMYTLSDWHDEERQFNCTHDFLSNYARRLWPSYKVERHHLSFAGISSVPRKKRSWIGGKDGTDGGCWPTSRLGTLFREYAQVLLEVGLLANAMVESPDALIAGILSVQVGPEIPAVAVFDQQNAEFKLEEGDEGMLKGTIVFRSS